MQEKVIKGQQPVVQQAPLVEKRVVEEGSPVDLGDCAKAVYRDRAGNKLGGGPSEGLAYRGTVAENAIQSVIDAQERETVKV